MSTQHQTGRGIIIHKDKMILMERWRDGLHYFSIPGGGVEAGETPEVATTRELHEELGLDITIIRKVYTMHRDNTIHHIFLCKYLGGEPRLHELSPEAVEHAQGNNRFKPGWVQLDHVGSAPLLYWEPLRQQLVHDLKYGFSVETKTITV